MCADLPIERVFDRLKRVQQTDLYSQVGKFSHRDRIEPSVLHSGDKTVSLQRGVKGLILGEGANATAQVSVLQPRYEQRVLHAS